MRAIRRLSLSMLAVGVVAGCFTLAAVTVEPAGGQATVAPPLTNEHLSARENAVNLGTIEIVANCNPPTGAPTISYMASGPVTFGPYFPGTYTETGAAELDIVEGVAQVVAFNAQFTINSAVGYVTGFKHSPTSVVAECREVFGVEVHAFEILATYTADITTLTGMTCHTEGESDVAVAEQDAPREDPAFFESFDEHFLTGTPCIAVCPPNDDEDDDGLIDSQESRFFTLLGNGDSDLDGIADGDDDANGNGEDDEDEDDDEDDGCPDEDSDGDGEDDEDEDDDD